jgi:hypothetical protein
MKERIPFALSGRREHRAAIYLQSYGMARLQDARSTGAMARTGGARFTPSQVVKSP